MKRKFSLLAFVAVVAAFFAISCGDDTTETYDSAWVGTYAGSMEIDTLAISNPAIDTLKHRPIIDTIIITDNGNASDNKLNMTTKVTGLSNEIVVSSATSGTLTMTGKTIAISGVTVTNVSASGTLGLAGSNLHLHFTATNGTVFGIPGVLALVKPQLSGDFVKQ